VDNRREGFLEYDDHTSMLDSLPRSLKALFVIAFHLGCRLGEVLDMKWSDVDWKNRVTALHAPRTMINGTCRVGVGSKNTYEHRRYTGTSTTRIASICSFGCPRTYSLSTVECGTSRTPIRDFRKSWERAVELANEANPNVSIDLLFHDLRRSGVRVMVQEAGIQESQGMMISGHKTRAMLERYNIVSLKNIQDAGAKLDAWSRTRNRKIRTCGTVDLWICFAENICYVILIPWLLE
jgi:integrase